MSDSRKIIIPAVSILIFITVGSILGYHLTSNKINKPSLSNLIPSKKKSVTVGKTKVFVEVADTAKTRQLGLSGKEKLASNEGMLFVFDREDTQPAFWMEGMQFGIDIIWINDGKVFQINQNIAPPEPDTPIGELTLYQSSTGIDYVLEVNAGFVKQHNISVGNPVDISGI